MSPAGWKKIGTYTCRGKIASDTDGNPRPYHIRLFDGRFDTAWRIERFAIRPGSVSDDASSTVNLVAKIATSSYGGIPLRADNWHFGDQRELAWASASFDSNATSGMSTPSSLVDKENLVVEDMWVFLNSYGDSDPGNFYIELTKYKVPKKVAILAMIKNLSMAQRLSQ